MRKLLSYNLAAKTCRVSLRIAFLTVQLAPSSYVTLYGQLFHITSNFRTLRTSNLYNLPFLFGGGDGTYYFSLFLC